VSDAGSNCPSGGERIDVWIDKNGNGMLDDGELQQTAFVCNGKDGNESTAGRCGDGVVQLGEECDDGNDVETDSCNHCRLAACGDGVIQTGVEACDDGNTITETACPPGVASCTACSSDCQQVLSPVGSAPGILSCPASTSSAPFASITFDGSAYATATIATWSWTAESLDPCGRLFTSTGAGPGFTMIGGDSPSLNILPKVVGDIQITLRVVSSDGQQSSCEWMHHVTNAGILVELCWDTEGTSDLDLHVHQSGTTAPWNGPADCSYQNCKATSSSPPVDWGYAASALAACANDPEGPSWAAIGSCRNPRLDQDNISSLGTPEIMELDDPNDGDRFRVAADYYGPKFGSPPSSHPVIAVYCGGALQTTLSIANGALNQGFFWRAADVTATRIGNSISCGVAPIFPPGQTSGSYITNDASNTF